MKEYDVIINIELEYLNMKKSIIIILSGFLVFQNIVAENFEHYIDNLMKETKEKSVYSLSLLSNCPPDLEKEHDDTDIFLSNIKCFAQLIALQRSLTEKDNGMSFEKAFKDIGKSINILSEIFEKDIESNLIWYKKLKGLEWINAAQILAHAQYEIGYVESKYKSSVASNISELSKAINNLRDLILHDNLYKSDDPDISAAVDIFKAIRIGNGEEE